MLEISRRSFLATAAAAAAGAMLLRPQFAQALPIALPIAPQGSDLTRPLTADLEGTLKGLQADGFNWIDWLVAGRTVVPQLKAMPAKDVRKLFKSYGFETYNVHATWADLHEDYDKTIQIIHDFEATSVIATTAPGRNQTLDDWKWHADELTKLGERTSKDGVLTGYHPHPVEFTDVDGVTPFDVLLQTDPKIVGLQIDLGACAAAGKDPVAYLGKSPDHYYSVHIKDVEGRRMGLAIGEGTQDWAKIFAAMKQLKKLRHYVVETGAYNETVMDKLSKSMEFLRNWKA